MIIKFADGQSHDLELGDLIYAEFFYNHPDDIDPKWHVSGVVIELFPQSETYDSNQVIVLTAAGFEAIESKARKIVSHVRACPC
jgi:hypothetical protein